MKLKEFIETDANEKPLDDLVFNGGACSVFKRICVIGDSLASGEFERKDETNGEIEYLDRYEYSWGAFMQRHTGAEVLNFSRGGMSAKWYWNSFAAENDFWNEDKLGQAYIIALGVNDLLNERQKVGDISDVDFKNYENNADTFAGYYSRIIQKIKSMRPDARFFLVTMTRGGCWNDPNDDIKRAHRDLLENFCKVFEHTRLIDLFTYAPVFDDAFYDKYFLGQHMSPVGYYVMSIIIENYIDYIVRHDPSEYRDVCFIGR